MQTVTVRCRAPEGARTAEVHVEVHVGPGLPGLTIVGLVETAVKESRDRVRAALMNSGFALPDRRIVINLAPADLPKSGSRYDLAIALGILCASDQLPADRLNDCEFTGELALTGELRAVPGLLPVAMGATAVGHRIVVPEPAGRDVALLGDERVLLAPNLTTVSAFLRGETGLRSTPPAAHGNGSDGKDLRDVAGQPLARRALEIAAAGGHHLLLTGPPGTGKSMLAERLPGLLPEPSRQAALSTAAVWSLRGIPAAQWPLGAVPFRSPHHSATAVAIAGGGNVPVPGEVSLAHNGVLFLDELPEFRREVLEVLREPLETGQISLARARHSVIFPARLQLVAAMNPCPCGFRGDPVHECRCTPDQVQRYRNKISGPLLDRIDLRVTVSRDAPASFDRPAGEDSAAVRARVLAVRERSTQRAGVTNTELDAAAIRRYCRPDADGRRLLESAARQFGLSHRACNRCLKLARTIADMADCDTVGAQHIAEALSLRTVRQAGAA